MDIENEIYESSYTNRTLFSVLFEVTTTCNWQCRHCYIPEHSNRGMSKEEILKIFEQMRELGVFELAFTGGDIFTRTDIIDIIREARKMGFKVFLLTNVSLLTEDMIKLLSELHIYQISCTIFSMKPEIHDYITQTKGSLQKVLENIQLIKQYGISLEVKTIITNLNCDEWKEINQFCKENGFSYNIDHDIYEKNDGDNSPKELCLSASQLKKELADLDNFREFKIKEHNNNEYVCSGIQNTLFIDSEGKVYPCNKFLYQVGDLHVDTLRNIWNNSKALHRIRDMRWGELQKCSTCEVEKFCIHCPGTALLEDGNEYGCSAMAYQKAMIRNKIYKTKVK